MNPCELALLMQSDPLLLECTHKGARCGYHKRGQKYAFSDLTSGDLCPEAYHNLYYVTLGILFNAKFEEKQLVVKCPGKKNYVVFKAGFERLNLRFTLLNVVKRMLRRFYPGQIYSGRLFWEIIKINGKCPLGHLIGARFYINKGNFQIMSNLLFPLGESYGLCPAIFDNFFPYLYSWRLKKSFPYSNGSHDLIHCPDHKANITFEIRGEAK